MRGGTQDPDSGAMLTIHSLPHRLHLIGRSLTSVVGSSHSTVCLPQDGHRKRRRVVSVSLSSDFGCNVSCKCFTSFYRLKIQIKKPAPQSHKNDYMAQALRLRRRFNCNTGMCAATLGVEKGASPNALHLRNGGSIWHTRTISELLYTVPFILSIHQI